MRLNVIWDAIREIGIEEEQEKLKKAQKELTKVLKEKNIKLFRAFEYEGRSYYGYEGFAWKQVSTTKFANELLASEEFKKFIEDEEWDVSETIWVPNPKTDICYVFEFRREAGWRNYES